MSSGRTTLVESATGADGSHSSVDPTQAANPPSTTDAPTDTSSSETFATGDEATSWATTSEASGTGTTAMDETSTGVGAITGSSGTTGDGWETTTSTGGETTTSTGGGGETTTSTGGETTTSAGGETTTTGGDFDAITCAITWTIEVSSMRVRSMTVDEHALLLGGTDNADGVIASYGHDGTELEWSLLEIPPSVGSSQETITDLELLPGGDLVMVVARGGAEQDALARVDRATGGTIWMRTYGEDDFPTGMPQPPPGTLRDWNEIETTTSGLVVAQGTGISWYGGDSVMVGLEPGTGEVEWLEAKSGFSIPSSHGLAVNDVVGAIWHSSTEQAGPWSHVWTTRSPSGAVDSFQIIDFGVFWERLSLTDSGEILVGHAGSGAGLSLERRGPDHNIISVAHGPAGQWLTPIRIDTDKEGRGFMLTDSPSANPRVFIAGNGGEFAWSDTIPAYLMGQAADLVVATDGAFYIAGRGTAATDSLVRRYDCTENPS